MVPSSPLLVFCQNFSVDVAFEAIPKRLFPYTVAMFLDEAIISVKGGAGGRGCVAFRHDKYEEKGGPFGGDGGDGGSVIILADENTDTLSVYASKKKFEADKGGFGLGKQCNGKAAEDLFLRVPPGTQVSIADPSDPEKFQVLADLHDNGDQVLVAKGGRGGYGNAHFKSSTRQAPDFAELGEPGESKILKLDLKLVADIGIIGYPSVGKSTLISVVSAARPKIADYPFTTLVPNLGVVHVGDRSFVICDVPGLIEGASEGKGLGHQFLRHIERCGALLHVLDAYRAFPPEAMSEADLDPTLLVADYKTIRKELEAYSPLLAKKRELVILNKVDLLQDITPIEKALKKAKIPLFATISAATKHGTDELMMKLLPIVLEEREHRMKDQQEEAAKEAKKIPVIRPQETSLKMGAYKVQKVSNGSLQVSGKRLEQFTVMTDFHNTGAIKRFKDVLERIGLYKVIKKHMQEEEKPVYIGSTRVDQHL